MHLFVNLPLAFIEDQDRLLRLFEERAVPPLPDAVADIGPELGFDAGILQSWPDARHDELLGRLDAASLPRSMHLPFFDLHPGSNDRYVLEATRRRLADTLPLARRYRPSHMVGHPLYEPWQHDKERHAWIERAAETWAGFLAPWPDHPPLYLENVHDLEPDVLVALVDSLNERGLGPVGVCLDLGHWHCMARGAEFRNLDAWLDALGPRLGHLHLHDNHGARDEHLAMGRGAIPWDEVAEALRQRDLRPTVTLEPHTEDDFAAMLDFFQRDSRLLRPL